MIKSFIILFSFVSFISASVLNNCFVFEDVSKAQIPTYLNVSIIDIDTSLLIYDLKDLPKTNIPLVPTQEYIQEEINGFGVCSDDALNHGLCSELGKFTINIKDEDHGVIVNEYVLKGQSKQFEIVEKGVYCLIAYQESESVKGVEIDQIHSYGHLSLEEFQLKNALLLSRTSLDLIILTIIGIHFYNVKKNGINVWASIPHSFIRNFVIISTISKAVPQLLLSYKNHSGKELSILGPLLMFPVRIFNPVLILKLFYSVSSGQNLFAPIHSDGDYSKFVKIALVFSGLAGFVKYLVVDLKLRSSLIVNLEYLMSLVQFFVWISFIIVLNKLNKQIEFALSNTNPTISKKIKRSRIAIIASLFAIRLIPFLYVFSISFNSINLQQSKLDPNEIDQSVFQNYVIQLIESLLQDSPWWKFIVIHLNTFLATFISLEILIIWKDTYNYNVVLPDQGSITLTELPVETPRKL